jgi:hypothetical protein
MENIIIALISTSGLIITTWIQAHYSSKNNSNNSSSQHTVKNLAENDQIKSRIGSSSELNQVSSKNRIIHVLIKVFSAVLGLVWQLLLIIQYEYLYLYQNKLSAISLGLSNIAWFLFWFLPCINLSYRVRKLSLNLGIIGNISLTFFIIFGYQDSPSPDSAFNIVNILTILLSWIVLFVIYFLYKRSYNSIPTPKI